MYPSAGSLRVGELLVSSFGMVLLEWWCGRALAMVLLEGCSWKAPDYIRSLGYNPLKLNT